jgi:hypothetical protein
LSSGTPARQMEQRGIENRIIRSKTSSKPVIFEFVERDTRKANGAEGNLRIE